ncbi:unnamed protein product [Pieris brassicae]|uniref:Uncharacterized protein n=1 Tax=Pieris brassicae TaxID=7116 RepID=A0A9P0X8C7_PIEBR|nr:unnamed protein product [Pieris brassicae]
MQGECRAPGAVHRDEGRGARRSPASRLALHAAGPRHSLPPQSSLWVSRRVELVDVGRHTICLSASRCVYGPVRIGFAGAFAAVLNAEPTAVLEIACVIIVTSAAARRDSARSPAPARRLTRARPLQLTISGARRRAAKAHLVSLFMAFAIDSHF